LTLIHDIKNAWRQGKVITILLLDIASAFPNAVTSLLLLNMQQLGYPMPLMKFFEVMLTDRHTTLVFDGSTSGKIVINNFIRQGDPSSMLLYLIYSYALVTIPTSMQGDGGAYVDNNFFMALDKDFMECDSIINKMLDTQESWSVAHNLHAEITKFKCLQLTRCANTAHPYFV